MPADDLVLNVRQIAGYSPIATAPPASTLLIQTAGLGSAYASISPAALVGTALALGGDIAIGGGVQALSFNGGSAVFSNAAVGLFSSQKASVQELCANFGSINGVPIATQDDIACLAASTVRQFNGRVGNVSLWIDDILCAGGAPIYSPRFTGSPRAETPPPWSNSTRLATTEWVTCTLGSLTLAYAPIDSPNFTGMPTAPTATAGSSDGQIATTAFVMNAVQDSTTGVVSFNGRTGIVVLTAADITAVGGALLASPTFTGVPLAPTAAPGTNTTQLATTAYVTAAVAAVAAGVVSFNGRSGVVTLTAADVAAVGVGSFNGRSGAVTLLGNDVSAAGGALVNSPVFTGVPSAPTAAVGTNTTQLATTAYVMAALVGSGGVVSFNGRSGIVSLTTADITGAGGAALASPAFTGTPTAPTAAPGTNNTQLATTAYVTAAIAAGVAGVASFNGRTGVVSLIANDLSAVGGALLASPAFTGSPTAPTATAGTNTTQLATTAFVAAAITAGASTALPLMDGTAAAGSSTAWSRGDHVHPTDTSRYSATNPSNFQTAAQVTASLAGYLPLSGGTITSGMTIQAVGTGNATLNLANAAAAVVGSLAWQQSNGAIFMSSVAGASSLELDGGGSFFFNGNGNAFKTGGTVWANPSDARIKTVEGDYTLGLAEITRLEPVVFRYKGNDTRTRRHTLPGAAARAIVGLVAQDVEAIFPDMVTKREGWIDGQRVDDFRDLDTGELIFALVNAVKTLAARVAALEGGSR